MSFSPVLVGLYNLFVSLFICFLTIFKNGIINNIKKQRLKTYKSAKLNTYELKKLKTYQLATFKLNRAKK